jgi:hypothetical protein
MPVWVKRLLIALAIFVLVAVIWLALQTIGAHPTHA